MDKAVLYILLLPLAGSAVNGLLGWKLPRRAVELVGCGSVGAALACSAAAFVKLPMPLTLYAGNWLDFAWFSAPLSFSWDAVSSVMALMVTGVSFLIHIYSVGYMEGDEGYARYYALMNLFVFSMLLLVLAAELPLMFVGWEGVGFCSYALIGFWYKDPANATAGRKAFIVTRVGDVAFGAAILWLFYFAGGTGIGEINALAAATMPRETAAAIGALLLLGAAGKSAQLPLAVWLPDAMAGPTPVSALIHAATMVTAGVYALMRLYPVIQVSEAAAAAVAAVGAVTALYAASAALAQRDIKKVLAYSTISQVGFMVLGVGAGAVTASLFHLVVHSFFKALLFMAAGCVIKAMHGERDITRMGGLAKKMPLVFWCFLAGALALSAAPGTGGFFSKDLILSGVYSRGPAYFRLLWAVGEAAALITVLYTFRAVYHVFFGVAGGEAKAEPAATPPTMAYALLPLAVLSIAGGAINLPHALGGSMRLGRFLSSQNVAGAYPGADAAWPLTGAAIAVFFTGLCLGLFMYRLRPGWRSVQAARYRGMLDLLFNAWYLDRLYRAVFVRGYVLVSGTLWKAVDEGVIDGLLEGLGDSLAAAGTWMRRFVTGRAGTYITATVAGAAALILYLALRSS